MRFLKLSSEYTELWLKKDYLKPEEEMSALFVEHVVVYEKTLVCASEISILMIKHFLSISEQMKHYLV